MKPQEQKKVGTVSKKHIWKQKQLLKQKESKLEQGEYTKEDPSSLFSKEKSLFNPTQDASKSSLRQPQASLKSLLPMTHDVVESSLPLPQHATECSSLVTQGILFVLLIC